MSHISFSNACGDSAGLTAGVTGFASIFQFVSTGAAAGVFPVTMNISLEPSLFLLVIMSCPFSTFVEKVRLSLFNCILTPFAGLFSLIDTMYFQSAVIFFQLTIELDKNVRSYVFLESVLFAIVTP